uniref:Myb/SANT-like domain-containing protein n=1 Tax=Glycine max TaxID=3847 RepID=A0A0R0KDU7_SOYBN
MQCATKLIKVSVLMVVGHHKVIQTVHALNKAGYTDITKSRVKNRLKTLKDRWREVHDLFNGLTGFAWNPVTNKFEAEEEVWAELIKILGSMIRENLMIDLNDVMNDSTVNDAGMGNFEGSPPPFASYSPYYSHSIPSANNDTSNPSASHG